MNPDEPSAAPGRPSSLRSATRAAGLVTAAAPPRTDPPVLRSRLLLEGLRSDGGASTLVSTILIGALVFLLGFSVAAGAVVYSDAQVQRIQVEGIQTPGDDDGDGEVDLAVEEITDVLHILLVGSDSREGLTDEERRRLRLGDDGESENTDTIMLARFDPRRGDVSLISFPRDLLVTRCDGTEGKINSAYEVGEETGVGGASCLVQTVTAHTGIPIHHFVSIDFTGFVRAVETLGGVTMYLDEPLNDERANLDLPAGCVTLSPADALGFVRARYLDNDFGRMARQQRFLREVGREVTSAGVLLNPTKLFRLVDTFSRTVQTDQELSLTKMRRIAFTMRDVSPDRLEARTVPGTDRTIDGVYYVAEREDEARALYTAFDQGSLVAEAAGQDADTAVRPEDVPPLRILNGSGRDGVATAASDLLSEGGFAVTGAEDAPEVGIPTTEIHHHPDRAREASLAGQLFPGSRVVEDPVARDDELVVVLGENFDPSSSETPETAPPPPPPPGDDRQFTGAETPSGDVDC